MFFFILRRLGVLIPTFFGITLITFSLIRMIPGDPIEVMMGERSLDPALHAAAAYENRGALVDNRNVIENPALSGLIDPYRMLVFR